ncbi:MAG: hypothetical protein ABSC03_15265 [Verrucomicrobiota bacterium]|jgi:hypothetical protein
MKRTAAILCHLFFAAALGLSLGCVDISIGSHRSAPPPPPVPAPMPPPVTNADDAATVAEVDAASRLSFDAGRLETLCAIAQRPGLSPAVQVHLINVGYRCLNFDSSKQVLLQKIIANPAFGSAARQAVVSQLNCLAFDSTRQAILHEVNQRQSAP